MRGEILTTSRDTKRLRAAVLTSAVIALVSLSLLGPSAVAAQEAPPSRTEELVKYYCGENGQMAVCLGRQPSECDALMRPLVTLCESQQPSGTEEEQAVAFNDCFESEFMSRYGKDYKLIPGCYKHTEVEGAIKPPPPEYEGKGIYVAPGMPLPPEVRRRPDF